MFFKGMLIERLFVVDHGNPDKLQTKNHPKVVLVILGGPGRNRTRASDV